MYAKEHKLKWIEDPSNQDAQYRRNAIRKKIIPQLEKIQPDAVASLSRSAKVLADAQTLLDRLALQDGNSVLEKRNLKVKPLLALAKQDLPAANNLVRFWLKSHGLAMPSQERLASWWKDLGAVKTDANLEWLHDELKIRLWRGILQVSEVKTGEWTFQKVSTRSKTPGLPAKWVQEAQKNGQISLQPRAGSEKIQIMPNTPRRSLKNLYQEADIPPWQRQAPLLFINGELIAVAGIGISYPHLVQVGARLMPEWG
jgi:tRNA(Ile)-lysidine synthase